LWRLVRFGHRKTRFTFTLGPFLEAHIRCLADGHPRPQIASPLDPPDDFFRMRLICTLLDACGMCFGHGSAKKKLDDFLVFFQVSCFFALTIPS
jgi:hypothetical protein